MLVKTAFFGEQNADTEAAIHFPAGLPGFEDCKDFKLFHQESETPVVFWLQSLERPEVAFSVTDPALVGIYYEFTLSDEDLHLLGGQGEAEDMIVAILLYKDESGAIKGSIKSPLVINMKTLKGLQKMLLNVEPLVTVKEKSSVIEFRAS
jgi:flagellar assembly factor FliW